MNLIITNKQGKNRVVSELTDLLFEEGWRFGRHVTNSYKADRVEENSECMFKRLNLGYVKILD